MQPIGEGNKWGKTVSASKRDIQDPSPPRTQEEFYARYDPLHIQMGVYIPSPESGLNLQSETLFSTGHIFAYMPISVDRREHGANAHLCLHPTIRPSGRTLVVPSRVVHVGVASV
jgi:hypothetical protein